MTMTQNDLFCKRSSKNENDKNDFDKNDNNTKIRLTPYGASLIVLDFPVTFPQRVACHLCCQVALGEAEGAALGSGCKQLGKLGKSGEGEEESYGGKDTAVDDSQWRTQKSTYEKKDGKNQRDIECFHQYKYLSRLIFIFVKKIFILVKNLRI